MAISETIDSLGHRQEILSSGGYYSVSASRDAALVSLGYKRYSMPDDLVHTLTDVWGSALPASARTAVLYFETNGVRLVCDGSTPSTTINGTPRAINTDYIYTVADLTLIKFLNSSAGFPAIVHLELFA